MAQGGRGRGGRDEADPYEAAAARLDADRRSRDLGDPIPALPPGLATPMPDRRKMRRTLYLIGAVLLILIVGRVTARSHAPELAASCTKVQLAINPSAVHSGRAVTWSATGPSGRAITLTVGDRQVSPDRTTLTGCKATGKFLVPVGPGRYDVTLRAGSATATARLSVTG